MLTPQTVKRHMARTLKLQTNARNDINGLLDNIKDRVSVTAAARWLKRLNNALQALSDDAERWPLTEEPSLADTDIRELLFGRRPHIYRVFYNYTTERVVVYRIRHSAQVSIDEDDI